MSPLRTVTHSVITTRALDGSTNGFLLPIYNANEQYFKPGEEPQQLYLTTILPGCQKGPHLHRIRRGWFTCIKGDIEIVIRIDGGFERYYSGESHGFLSVEIPPGIPALLRNTSTQTAFVLNMPAPAWAPDMNDEHTADFSDFGD